MQDILVFNVIFFCLQNVGAKIQDVASHVYYVAFLLVRHFLSCIVYRYILSNYLLHYLYIYTYVTIGASLTLRYNIYQKI